MVVWRISELGSEGVTERRNLCKDNCYINQLVKNQIHNF